MNIGQILHLKTKIKESFSFFVSGFQGSLMLTRSFVTWGCMIGSFLPLFFVILFWCWLSNRSELMEGQLSVLEEKARFLVKLQKQRNRFFQEFGLSDENFLVNYIETEPLLDSNLQYLKKIQQVGEYSKYEPITERIKFLTEGENKLKFSLLSSSEGVFYKEKLWKLERPVEMNCEDVKKILALIEGVKIDKYLPNPMRPQLGITKFDLILKPQGNRNKVFCVDMEVLQRGCHEVEHS